MRAVIITAVVIASLLIMTTDVLVAMMVTNYYWGIACIPACGLIGWGIAWVTRKHGRQTG